MGKARSSSGSEFRIQGRSLVEGTRLGGLGTRGGDGVFVYWRNLEFVVKFGSVFREKKIRPSHSSSIRAALAHFTVKIPNIAIRLGYERTDSNLIVSSDSSSLQRKTIHCPRTATSRSSGHTAGRNTHPEHPAQMNRRTTYILNTDSKAKYG